MIACVFQWHFVTLQTFEKHFYRMHRCIQGMLIIPRAIFTVDLCCNICLETENLSGMLGTMERIIFAPWLKC